TADGCFQVYWPPTVVPAAAGAIGVAVVRGAGPSPVIRGRRPSAVRPRCCRTGSGMANTLGGGGARARAKRMLSRAILGPSPAVEPRRGQAKRYRSLSTAVGGGPVVVQAGVGRPSGRKLREGDIRRVLGKNTRCSGKSAGIRAAGVGGVKE